jgi:Anti-sigma-K factor rskA
MMTHEEASPLLAAFSLDAVEPDESALIQQHVAVCLRCQAEVDAHHEVASALGNSVVPLPAELWQSISHRLTGLDDVVDLVAPVHHLPVPTEHVEPRQRLSRTLHSSRARFATAATVAVGAAAMATVLGINLANANNQVAHLEGAIGETAHTEVVAALETPGHTLVKLTNVHHRAVAQFVLLPSGRGYLVTSRLPALPSTETYQLWGLTNDNTVSLGLLGRAPHLATFTSAGSSRPHSLGITVETAGGALQPRGPMLASGTV